jgi:hypothetical protein
VKAVSFWFDNCTRDLRDEIVLNGVELRAAAFVTGLTRVKTFSAHVTKNIRQ